MTNMNFTADVSQRMIGDLNVCKFTTMKDYNDLTDGETVWWWIKRLGSSGLCLILLSMWGCPNYSVYQQNLEGEAELARATQNRQISIQEAQAKKESAKDLAEAEVIRAEGAARANKIIGESLKNNEIKPLVKILTPLNGGATQI